MPDHNDPPPADVSASVSHGRRWSAGRPILEVFLIALGVFLGLAGEQWRGNAERRERALETLRRIRAEMAANRDEVKRVVDYHADALHRLKEFFAAPAAKRAAFRLDGIMPARLDQTAWELAQSTQALVDIDPELSFALARVYGTQKSYNGLTEGITNAMYLRPPNEDATAFLRSLSLYYSDVVILEPALEKMYADMLPQIDRALAR
jgi:hypothetical protein